MKVIDEINKVDDVLRKVGNVLIVAGIIDIGVFIYCIMNQYGYSSNLGLFAIIAGVYLRRGSLRVAQITSFLSGFYFITFLFNVMFLITEFSDSLIQFYLDEGITAFELSVSFAFSLCLIILYYWVYRTLTQELIISAMIKYKKIKHFFMHPRTGIVIGLIIVIVTLIQFNNVNELNEVNPQQLSSQLLNP